MKALLAILIFLSASAYAESDYSFKPDKAKHLIVSTVLYTGGYWFCRKAFQMDQTSATIFSIVVTGTIGFTKEYMDMMGRRGSGLDGGDLVYDGIGIGIGVIGTTFIIPLD